MRMRKKSVCAFILLLCLALAWGIADSAGAVYDIGVSAMFSTDRAALPVDMLGARSPGDYEATLSDIMSLIAIAERFA